ncbi:hypothetical protein LH51_04055 [Nitrincola sp. A-D6]|nr:hypothetical protein LH51_04055 [Nitrincola sp. A-D6]
MTRYFFAIFIALAMLILNAAVLSVSLSGVTLIISLLAINSLSLSLILFWLGGYSRNPNKIKYLVLGHAALYLSAGVGMLALGYHVIEAQSCQFLLSDSHSNNLIHKAALWATENNFCPWLGAGLIAFGMFMAWPSLKLFIGIQAKGA